MRCGKVIESGRFFEIHNIADGAKRILWCSSKICNEAGRGDMGLDTLQVEMVV